MEPHADSAATQPSPSPLIAVIDDDPAIRQLLHDGLSEDGYRTLLVAEATQAIDILQHARPNLIILDIWLERAESGWMILDTLQHDRLLYAVPVIVCSGNAFMLGTMVARRQAPHHAFLAKPFATDELLRTVATLLAGHRQASTTGGMSHNPA